MECLYCKGKLIRATAPFSVDRNGYHITWESIPAWVCTQCEEPLCEENEVNHIQKALQQVDQEQLLLCQKSPNTAFRWFKHCGAIGCAEHSEAHQSRTMSLLASAASYTSQ